MRRFAETCEAVAATTKKNATVRLVSAYLLSISLEDAVRAAIFFSAQRRFYWKICWDGPPRYTSNADQGNGILNFPAHFEMEAGG
jgi:hypothetical protein